MKKYSCDPFVFGSPPGRLDISSLFDTVRESEVVVVGGECYLQIHGALHPASTAKGWHDSPEEALYAAAEAFDKGAAEMAFRATQLRDKAARQKAGAA